MAAKQSAKPGSEALPLGNESVVPGAAPVSDLPRVNAPQGQVWLPSAAPAPATPIVRKPNMVVEAQAGLPWLPSNAPASTPKNPDGSPVRGGLGGGNTGAGGDAGNSARE